MKENETHLRALEFAVLSPHSDFYRKKYGTGFEQLLLGPLSSFPFLTRAEIDRVPVLERAFVPRNMICFIRSTSGSTGRGVVGFPMLEEPELEAHRRALGFEIPKGRVRYFEPYMQALQIRSILMFSAGAFVHEPRLRIEEGRNFIAGEYAQPKVTAQLAKETNIDCIVANPSGLVEFAPYLKEQRDLIRLIISVGERPTELQLETLKGQFKNAEIVLQYGLTETQGLVGYTCPERATFDPKALHPAAGSIYFELIDPDTEVSVSLVPGNEGEVVITTLEPLGFPLIRYRTGDFARIREGTCSCDGNPMLFECMGRLALDRIRIPRGVLTIASVESAVLALPFPISEYEAKWNTDTEPPGLELKLYVADAYMAEAEQVSSFAIAERLYVAPSVTYASLAEEKLVSEVSVEFLRQEAYTEGWKKKKRLS